MGRLQHLSKACFSGKSELPQHNSEGAAYGQEQSFVKLDSIP